MKRFLSTKNEFETMWQRIHDYQLPDSIEKVTFPLSTRIYVTANPNKCRVQCSRGRCVLRLILRYVERVSPVPSSHTSVDDVDKAERLAMPATRDLSGQRDRSFRYNKKKCTTRSADKSPFALS